MTAYRRQHSKRGSMLLTALLMFTLLLALGLGMMTSQAARRKAAFSQRDAIQAKSLALSAWADVRAKLGKDLFFPPQTDGQGFFSYGEDLFDENGNFYGSYSVVLDTRYVAIRREHGDDPALDAMANVYYGYYLITCTGKVGRRGKPPVAERTMYYEVDAATLRVIRMEDRESL